MIFVAGSESPARSLISKVCPLLKCSRESTPGSGQGGSGRQLVVLSFLKNQHAAPEPLLHARGAEVLEGLELEEQALGPRDLDGEGHLILDEPGPMRGGPTHQEGALAVVACPLGQGFGQGELDPQLLGPMQWALGPTCPPCGCAWRSRRPRCPSRP